MRLELRCVSSRIIAVTVAALLVGGGGCVSSSYRIPASDLRQLSQTPPEQRGERVRVIQEISESSAPPAERIDGSTDVVVVPNLHVSSGIRLGGGGRSGGGRGGKLGGSGADGKGAAIAFLVVAATALVVVAAIEGSRFDGWARLHPMHPVHLFGHDGTYLVRPLAWIDPQTAAWTEKAIVRSAEGPWHTLDQAPLTRTGLTYGMYGGSGSLRSVNGEKELGPAFSVQFGYFPTQEVGVLANVFFGWRDNVVGETLFESRYTLEVQALPVVLGPLHAGFYAGAGLAYRFEDGTKLRNTNEAGSTALTGGAMLQLELHTRIALTARFGLARAHGERMSDLLVGLSVY
ncbi:MAG: hypothetical protein H0X17_13500 [Deltaproteobacteria bacterium]|nr:hypothetical protein [Deltaproteobacteria bacterium]